MLHPDHFDGALDSSPNAERWSALRQKVSETGLRNSLLVAIAPTATIASIAGCYECIEPQVSNLFKRETLSGEFLQVNTALVRELKARDLWTPEVREAIKKAEGSVAGITALPDGRELPARRLENPYREPGAAVPLADVLAAAEAGQVVEVETR